MTGHCVCPSCGSDLLQPLRWEQRTPVEVVVELRCPECSTWMSASRTLSQMADLDRRQAAARETIVAAYEDSVRANMSALADRLHEAFLQDLISADDFRPAVRRPAA